MRRLIAALCLAVLAGCVSPVSVEIPQDLEPLPASPDLPRPDVQTAAKNFVAVIARMEPLIESECRARARGRNCDFRIVVDDRRGQPPNAYQTLDPSGRPVIAFTVPLIADARNVDELAFIMGHEAAHHILDHIGRQQDSAMLGAILTGGIAAATGADAEAVRSAQDLGAVVGARRYSKGFELEADELGTIIAFRAGYDPVRGAAFFARIPDPGNRFLGTHPPNAERMRLVAQTVARLQ
jgi:Zn-dependent protease with chaperone function